MFVLSISIEPTALGQNLNKQKNKNKKKDILRSNDRLLLWSFLESDREGSSN